MLRELDDAATARLLDRFYGVFAGIGVVSLLAGVPFLYVEKRAGVVVSLILLLTTAAAWRVTRSGHPGLALKGFAAVLWLVQISLLYGGLPPGSVAIAIAVSLVLTVVTGLRSGLVYGLSLLAAWLIYILLSVAGKAPPVIFTAQPILSWFIAVAALWLVLLPTPGLVAQMREALGRTRELAEAHASLRESEAKYRELVENAGVLILRLDSTGRITYFNEFAERFFGYSSAEVLGRSALGTILPPELAATLDGVLAATDLIADHEHENLTRDGRRVFVHWTSKAIRDPAGHLTGLLCIGRDVGDRRRAEQALQAAKAYAESLLRAANVMIVELDQQGCVRSINPAAERVLGYRLNELVGRNWFETVTPRQRFPGVWQEFQAILARGGSVDQFENAVLTRSGEERYISWHNSQVMEDGKVIGTVGFGMDVTEQRALERRLRESEEQFRTIADYTYGWEYWQGVDGRLLYVNPACERISGYTPTEFLADPGLLGRIIHPDDQPAYSAHRAECGGLGDGQLEFRIVTKSGEVRWIAHGCRSVRGPDGRSLGRRASNRDVTELKEAEQQARQLAFMDSLTGLPNRRLLQDRLDHGLAQALRHHRSLAVMFMDLDRFKQINDTLGHDQGDAVLREVARRLVGCIRAGDTIARSGGDEFIAVLPEIARPDDAAVVAEKILQAVAEPIRVAGRELAVTASIGVAIHGVAGSDTASDLMKKADIAMYAAKQAGRNRYRLYDEDMAADQTVPAI